MGASNLKELLRSAATRRGRGITFHCSREGEKPFSLSYRELLQTAKLNATLLRQAYRLDSQEVVVIHFSDHYSNIVWFWTAIEADLVPLMSTPFAHHPEQRAQHILHLNSLASRPLWITSASAVSDFGSQIEDIRLCLSEQITKNNNGQATYLVSSRETSAPPESGDLAALMLTSGSTGAAKAVRLTHGQILAAIEGKMAILELGFDEIFLTWVGLDHVAGLIETHILAMRRAADQIMIPSHDILADPQLFLCALSDYKVTYTFAPNFLLTKLAVLCKDGKVPSDRLDFRSLKNVISGGEANGVEIGEELSLFFQSRGATCGAVVPAFGMTETCGGSIYNRQLALDIKQGCEFASLGHCGPEIELRIAPNSTAQPAAGAAGIGALEIRGRAVFDGYFNNPEATADAFTDGGWFSTGDQGFLDAHGRLHLTGRSKEIININGLKYSPHQVETAIENRRVAGIAPGHIAVFSYRPDATHTEQVVVLYKATYDISDVDSRLRVRGAIYDVVLLCLMTMPCVLPLDATVLRRSSIGKLSRTKLQRAFQSGEFASFQLLDEQLCQSHRGKVDTACSAAINDTARTVIEECNKLLGDSDATSPIDAETDLFQAGISSVSLLQLKSCLQERLGLKDIPLITLMTHRTARSLAETLQQAQRPQPYDPLVILREDGTKAPLWLVHPGVGEVLVFFGLAKHVEDRPVYALRARGFNDGEQYFKDIPEVVAIYLDSIRTKQPAGPIAIAGYSYGSMLAFEIAKQLRAEGRDVRFVGSFNLPPHIKTRMKMLDWHEVLLSLSCFLDFLTFPQAASVSPHIRQMSDHMEAVKYIMSISDTARVQALGLSALQVLNWANLALGLQSMACDYDPSGTVDSIDVFCAIPLAVVATSMDDWRHNHLDKWADFSVTPPRFHQVQGEHYTMMNKDNVAEFHSVLQRALAARGV